MKMSMDVKKLKEIGKDVEMKKVRSQIQPKVLAIVKANTKQGKAVTQKEVAEVLSKQLERDIRPQHARSALLALRKQGKVVRRIMSEADETGNTHFWYTPS